MKLTYNAPTNAVDLTNESWVKSLDPVVADQSTVDGKLYGAEVWDVVAANYWVMTYNKAIFAKYNLTVPKTFAEFETVCATLLQNGITPVYEPISDGWHQVLWFPSDRRPDRGARARSVRQAQREPDDLRRRREREHGHDPAQRPVPEGLLRQDRPVRQGSRHVQADGQRPVRDDPLRDLSRDSDRRRRSRTFKATDFGYFPIPLLDNQLQPAHPAGPTWMISSKSAHVAEAKEWLNFMMSPDNLQWLIDNTPDFQTLPFTGVKPKWDASQQAFFDTYKQATGRRPAGRRQLRQPAVDD